MCRCAERREAIKLALAEAAKGVRIVLTGRSVRVVKGKS